MNIKDLYTPPQATVITITVPSVICTSNVEPREVYPGSWS